MSTGTPPAEVQIDEALVRSLLRDQHPDLADLPLKRVESGWDNEMLRLGDSLAVRLPRRQMGASLIESEQKWLPVLAPTITFPAPIPIRNGIPGNGYPWHWSVVPWIDGEEADRSPPAADQAPLFAKFLKSLHQPAPEDAPQKPFRGIPLADLADTATERLEALSGATPAIPDVIPNIWDKALAAPAADERRWLHGDLHTRNVLVRDGRIVGIIDWGDMTTGDAATDLGFAWALFAEKSARETVLRDYGASEEQVLRAKGWAVLIGTALLLAGRVDDTRHAEAAWLMLERLAEDAD